MIGRDYASACEAVELFDAHPYLPVPDSARILTLGPGSGYLLTSHSRLQLVTCYSQFISENLRF